MIFIERLWNSWVALRADKLAEHVFKTAAKLFVENEVDEKAYALAQVEQ